MFSTFKLRCLSLVAGLVVLSLTQLSHAQPTQPSVGIDLVYGRIKNPLPAFFGGGDNVSLIGIGLHGHYKVGPKMLVGGRLPLAHARFNNDSATTLGNLTAELNYQLSKHSRGQSWLDTSLSLATADDNGDGQLAASTFATFSMPDPGLYAPDTTTFRMMYRHLLGEEQVKFEFQGGIQFLAVSGAEDIVRLPFRIGVAIKLGPKVRALGRFSTFWITNAEDNEDDFYHMIEGGMNLHKVGQGELDLLVYYPLDKVYRDGFGIWGLQLGWNTAL